MDDLRLRRNRILEHLHQIFHARRRHGELQLTQLDAVTTLTLLPCGDHARVILIRRDDLVTAPKVHSQLHVLECFTGIARNRDLFGIAAEHLRKPTTYCLETRVEDPPHVVSRSHVLDIEITFFCVRDDLWRRGYAAVIQIDHVAIHRKCMANIHPVVFVSCYGVRGPAVAAQAGGLCKRDSVRTESRSGNRRESWQRKKASAVHSI